ncbi:hypothetical protein NEUTE1DRAFT_43853 [Neurospora tetrasperma FGSC 2508]|uniref:Uncharacterized protein n=1 Tax=Neurospora tetrasperma (strain FGSC 2508 / ATCC MYA-4615 / P0657) TaxID=510951 RepID=F8MP80_NEUT8|nr:uncharacterized protein NEUTE1DRAFT_43853 [Neurospora tetrasperma FGSC 2508]EGO57092.1 hypothetical protein NEUTE1DRAFT_43853 [Neurospora tetrasperma FGSC 2508]EGZ69993.1 hypothetical protein NEUTE2DRAFT_130019 [Neurospora tetrasperma FGSC 2509]
MIGCCESGDIGTKAVALSNMFHQSDGKCSQITPRRNLMMAAVTANRLTARCRSKASVLFIYIGYKRNKLRVSISSENVTYVGLNGDEYRAYLSHGP